jgi:hypothetical protein
MRLSLVIGLRGGYQVDDHGISDPQLISLALALAVLPALSVPASAFRHHVFYRFSADDQLMNRSWVPTQASCSQRGAQ